ncbi:MAG TPA: hypothetical protein VF062_17855, partial [Candidatus Limnocylindrales bacterium]
MDYDGRYEGSGDSYSVALRIDVGGSGVISADIFRGTDYLTSVRTRWGLRCDSAIGRWAAEFSASVATTGSGLVAGTMTIAPNGEPSAGLIVTVRPDMDLPGLPAGQDAVVTVEWRGAEVRELGLEVETEEDVVAPGPTAFAGTDINERECLRRAGFAVRAVGAPGRIPRQAEPWDFSRMFTLLHDTMTARAQSDLSAAAWQLHLLLLSDSTLEGLQGIMFDGAGVLPRQGAAVFLDEIRAYAAAHHHNPDRNAIRTVVHELGHALNLAHRWEPQVGHLESTSFMNYPWKFVPGGTDAYWTEFKFTFDADELEFLRHGPLGAVRPGDAPFHSVAYWSGNGWLPPAP